MSNGNWARLTAAGQAVTVLWGWVLVSLISLAIAASLAEICAGTSCSVSIP